MKYISCTLLLCLLFACEIDSYSDWKTLDFEVFRMKVPKAWREVKRRGIDTYVGDITNGSDTITFAYGRLLGEDCEVNASLYYLRDTVNGLPAIIHISRDKTTGAAGMIISLKKDVNKFFIGGYELKDIPTVLKIFKSITFPEGDTTLNPPLKVDEFGPDRPLSGKCIYQVNCAGCHHRLKDMTGPALADVLAYRDEQWIYQFLTDRRSIVPDSLTNAYRERFAGAECMSFPHLTKLELRWLISYLQ